ncbi:hypothetical protein AgCh_036399 [Apium graveolens]
MDYSKSSLEDLYARLSIEDEESGGVILGKEVTVLSSLWRPKEGVEIQDIGGRRYSFVFYHPMDLKKVLEGGPWAFEQGMLVYKQISENEDPNEVLLNDFDMWVQVYDIPKGHSERDCDVVYDNPGKEIERAYGPWLRAPGKNSKTPAGSRWLRNAENENLEGENQGVDNVIVDLKRRRTDSGSVRNDNGPDNMQTDGLEIVEQVKENKDSKNEMRVGSGDQAHLEL